MNPSSAGGDPVVAVLFESPAGARALLEAIRILGERGAAIVCAAAPDLKDADLAGAPEPIHRDNSYLESFIGGAGRRCLLRAGADPGPLATAVSGLCARYGIPTVAAGSDPGSAADEVLARARGSDSPDGRTETEDGRPLRPDMGYERYVRLLGIAEKVQGGMPGSYSVLDVGGEDEALRGFLPGSEYTAFDGLIGEGRGTGLADRSFDVVIAADVLEHVPPADRGAFLTELVRVARVKVVFSFPCSLADPHERFLLRLMPQHRWLAEHQEHGLPDRDEVEGLLRGLGLDFERTPNHSLQGWVYATLFDNLHIDEGLRRAVNLFHQDRVYPLEGSDPAYRHIYVVSR